MFYSLATSHDGKVTREVRFCIRTSWSKEFVRVLTQQHHHTFETNDWVGWAAGCSLERGNITGLLTVRDCYKLLAILLVKNLTNWLHLITDGSKAKSRQHNDL